MMFGLQRQEGTEEQKRLHFKCLQPQLVNSFYCEFYPLFFPQGLNAKRQFQKLHTCNLCHFRRLLSISFRQKLVPFFANAQLKADPVNS